MINLLIYGFPRYLKWRKRTMIAWEEYKQQALPKEDIKHGDSKRHVEGSGAEDSNLLQHNPDTTERRER